MKKINAKQRTDNNHMKKGNFFSGFPFAHNRHPYVVTILDYYKSKILPGIRIAGEYESITDASPTIYGSLKKNGFAFVRNAFEILPKDVIGLKSFLDFNKSSFQRLFTDFKRGGSDPIFLSLKGPGRYVATTPAVIDSVILHDNGESPKQP